MIFALIRVHLRTQFLYIRYGSLESLNQCMVRNVCGIFAIQSGQIRISTDYFSKVVKSSADIGAEIR